MKTRRFGLGTIAVAAGMLLAMSTACVAQRGGAGGGGNGGGSGGGGTTARHGGNYNVIWDSIQAVNGRTPKVAASVGVSTYVAVLDTSVRVSACDLPDNSELTVTVYSVDYFTGEPWPAKVVGTIPLLKGAGSLPSTTFWVTSPGFLPVVTSIVVTEPDGTVVASGHP